MKQYGETGEMWDEKGIRGFRHVFKEGKNKFLALILTLAVSVYVITPDNAANSDPGRNGVDCTGLIAVNYLNFA
jgi:hypothetical protein